MKKFPYNVEQGGIVMFSWNIIGILTWVAIILYLVFIIQNIRRRRIKMIIKQHKHFSWPNFILNIVEVVILFVAAGWMFNQTFMDNPDLEDASRITSSEIGRAHV